MERELSLRRGAQRILKFLEARQGGWISRLELLGLGLRNYRQRIGDLRRAGYRIQNRRRYRGEIRDSWYRLVG